MPQSPPAPLDAAKAASLFSTRLFGFINRRVKSRDVAEDLLQQVLLRVTRHEEKLATVDDPKAWLFAVTRSVIADHYRRSNRPHPDMIDWMERDEPDAAAILADCIGPLLSQLPPAYKEALTRADLGGETLVALAQEKGLSPSAMKSRAQRARKMLRSALVASCHVELDRRGRVVSAEEHKGKCC